ncbi:MAG TPA: methylated-DNA--[protein]-cysteine S-methyltransferase [Spirochaetales bacterium]|nr:methylated-DNA--[protein]-cysteine S-methyltransferase [Spirochaetales bacterium]
MKNQPVSLFSSTVQSPLGTMEAIVAQNRLCLLEFSDRPGLAAERLWLERHYQCPCKNERTQTHERAFAQLAEYFSGTRTAFDLELEYPGTDFQRSVWAFLLSVPYGSTMSYGTMAAKLGKPSAARAVAAAIGQNRLAILIPCHRIVGANGALTGYAGGLQRKRQLLELEAGAGIAAKPTD